MALTSATAAACVAGLAFGTGRGNVLPCAPAVAGGSCAEECSSLAADWLGAGQLLATWGCLNLASVSPAAPDEPPSTALVASCWAVAAPAGRREENCG
jgi:hypothetical protein